MTTTDKSLEVPIYTLKPGQKFWLSLAPYSKGLHGEVVDINRGSVTVRINVGRKRTFTAICKKTGEQKGVEIAEAARVEHWCLESLVIPEGRGF